MPVRLLLTLFAVCFAMPAAAATWTFNAVKTKHDCSLLGGGPPYFPDGECGLFSGIDAFVGKVELSALTAEDVGLAGYFGGDGIYELFADGESIFWGPGGPRGDVLTIFEPMTRVLTFTFFGDGTGRLGFQDDAAIWSDVTFALSKVTFIPKAEVPQVPLPASGLLLAVPLVALGLRSGLRRAAVRRS